MYGKNRRRAAKPSPAAKPVPLPDALLEGVERPRASVAEFRRPARRYTLVMAGADARELFLSLARENDFNLVLSPEVSGTVTMDIKEATAEELMDEVCGMLGCRAVFGGNTVRVAPEKRVTRVFTVDYLLTGRTGTGSLMASTSASGGGGSGGSTTTSESQSTNSVITEEKADFWGGARRGDRGAPFPRQRESGGQPHVGDRHGDGLHGERRAGGAAPPDDRGPRPHRRGDRDADHGSDPRRLDEVRDRLVQA